MSIINFKSFIKHLLNNRLYTLITIIGFAFSLTFVLLLSVYLKNELSINAKQEKKDRIYHLRNEDFSTFAPPIGKWLQSEFPEIEAYTRVFENTAVIKIPKKEDMVMFNSLLVDSTFFTIFDVELLEGNKSSVLNTKNSIVLSKEYAQKLFGDKSPIGQQITLNKEIKCTITGVFDNLSKDTHFKKVDGLINFKLLGDIWNYPEILTSYGNCSFDFYFLAKPNTDLPSKAPQILQMFKKHFWIYRDKRVRKVIFEPLKDVYFSKISGTGIRQNNKMLIDILMLVVLLILILAVINYVNLSIAQSGNRAKNIAIRKLLGSSRATLIFQYVLESIILVSIAFSFAIILSFLAENTFNELMNTTLNLKSFFSTTTTVFIAVFIVLLGFISGIIPALSITKVNALEIIKGGFRRKTKGLYSRVLISFQYIIVIVLLISAMVISRQSNYMLHKDLGFNKDNIIKLPFYIDTSQEEALRSELLKIPTVNSVSFVAGTPVDGGNNNSFIYNDKPVSFQVFKVDSAFLKMMKLNIQPTGTAYSKNGIWINKTGIRTLELNSLPNSVTIQDSTIPILGVIDDFHFKSLKEKIGNLIIYQMDSTDYPWSMLVQIDGKNIKPTTDKILATYKTFTEGIPIEFNFFDTTIARWYAKEKRISTIIKYFTILSIIIAIIGIYAMSVFYKQQRIKEIGIRKVNGATVMEIVVLLLKDFIKWVAVAFVISVPIAWYAMNTWLNNYPYHIHLSYLFFIIAGLFVLILAVLTVSLHTFSAARKNPVESLRYE